MLDRLSVAIGAGVITAGMSAALLAGAGAAIAAPDQSTGGETSSPSRTPGTGNARSQRHDAPDAGTRADNAAKPESGPPSEDAKDAEDQAEDQAVDQAEDARGPVKGAEADPVSEVVDEKAGPVNAVDIVALPTNEPTVEPAVGPAVESAPAEVASDVSSQAAPATVVVAAPERIESGPVAQTESAQEVTRLTMVSAAGEESTAQASAPRQTLLSIIGTVIFNLYSFAIRVASGPPLLPWGSTVTVRSSKLEIDCGDGYSLPADWYVPEGPTPTRLILLQHGFLAAGPFYSYTAARLAEATHSIVVAPSLTSNFLACDGCWLGGSPMHKAVADLFLDGNTALADSALAAGYSSTLLDGVEKVALIGHSLGGGLVAGTAGYMQTNGTADRLAGVVMLDGVGFGSVLPEALAKLPDDVPIYNIAGMSYFWNMNGSGGAALEKAFPGRFNGVRLIGGLHSDPMAGGNPLIQIGLYAVTGFSWPVNIKAPEILSAAWINDMFAGKGPSEDSPYYGAPKSIMKIDTPYGTANAYVQPGPTEILSILDVVFNYFAKLIFSIDFATCATPEAAPSARQADDLTEFPTPNTALSLDGRAKASQSIGQHVCTG